MVWQAFIDESEDGDGNFVLAGYIASAENWSKFSAEWEQMLPFARLQANGTRRFKMSEMALSEEYLERTAAFYRIIERHAQLGLSFKINSNDLRAARHNVHVFDADKIPWEIEGPMIENHYLFGFRVLTQFMKDNYATLLRQDGDVEIDKVDFIFDDRSEKRLILEGWDNYISNVGHGYIGATPRFENDEDFLPLQAADFYAQWARKWAQEGVIVDLNDPPFPWKRSRVLPYFSFSMSADNMTDTILGIYRGVNRDDVTIIDLRTVVTTTRVSLVRALTIAPAPPLKRR